ncbi:hypothetical protein PSm6_51770 [Pseudomonas solani]|uniref:DUF1190 domain-containing protein n=1 Tax=Pseudomonas solani TaxID=2731552 RepID=A0ABN6C031_9PSED|nr:DUF1190 domain-containing protein [Pseudomonas solani]EQM66707.1 hypothetical protein L682_03805 [Pseudomonas alcaligenes OT 69]MDN4145744.1 DUF1190 domain-containing protein [Pseudomonas tohonis]BCD88770.1 hypothetical protein PSm6_51770 [Pseudomonas solani]
MRKRNSIQLVLAGTLPLALAGCNDPQDTMQITATKTFKNVQACVADKFPVDVCSDAYMTAMADHKQIAPTYDSQAACDADFVPDYCQPTSNGQFMPRLGGFELSMTNEVSRSTYEQAEQQVVQSTGHSDNGLVTGILIGQMMGNGGNHYYSQPIYRYRDARGSYSTSTLSRQIEQGKTFSRSNQARNSPTSTYTQQTLGKSLSSKASTSGSAVASTISRGGFGSQANARGGWGGKTGGSGFGG